MDSTAASSSEDLLDGLSSSNSYEGRIGEEEEEEEEASSSSSDGSPLGWPLCRRQRSHSGFSFASTKSGTSTGSCKGRSLEWEKRDKHDTTSAAAPEVEMMKEKFAKLLLGEDMSGGAKGVCTALAISNAITNLAASVFGELWRLEPLSPERKTMWRREMEWLLSVSDYIVELVPAWQTFGNGNNMEIMVSRPRSDIHINLPALRKLDAMLLESLDTYKETEFWYVEQGIVLPDKEESKRQHSLQRQEGKWWLPTPRVPSNGLSDESRKGLQSQRDCVNQILKAAMSINSQVLSEMEVPDVFWETLPKTGKSCLGELLHRGLTAEKFSPDALLQHFDLSTEHSAVELANRIEAALQIWQRKQRHLHQQQQQQQHQHQHHSAKSSWGKVKDLVTELDRPTLIERAESLLLSLKQRFPGLPQTVLDMNKIQYNKDVGQSILESYSRVLESLAYNILARIDDVLFIDDAAREGRSNAQVPTGGVMRLGRMSGQFLLKTPYATPLVSPSCSPPPAPVDSPRKTNSPRRSYARNLETRKLVSPPGRD